MSTIRETEHLLVKYLQVSAPHFCVIYVAYFVGNVNAFESDLNHGGEFSLMITFHFIFLYISRKDAKFGFFSYVQMIHENHELLSACIITFHEIPGANDVCFFRYNL